MKKIIGIKGKSKITVSNKTELLTVEKTIINNGVKKMSEKTILKLSKEERLIETKKVFSLLKKIYPEKAMAINETSSSNNSIKVNGRVFFALDNTNINFTKEVLDLLNKTDNRKGESLIPFSVVRNNIVKVYFRKLSYDKVYNLFAKAVTKKNFSNHQESFLQMFKKDEVTNS